jgi:hypothetical protein
MFSAIAVAPRVSSLGPGVDLATPLSRSFNLRAGASLFNFSYSFRTDGMNYYTSMNLRSGQLSLDWFPTHKSFHISPGLVYSTNNLDGRIEIPVGQSFELGGRSFTSSANDPVHGTVSVLYPRKIAPSLTIGFVNMIPRTGKHFSFPVDLGAAYTDVPKINLTLIGTACIKARCFDLSKYTETQTGLQQEMYDINETLKRIPVYPILSAGVSYRF